MQRDATPLTPPDIVSPFSQNTGLGDIHMKSVEPPHKQYIGSSQEAVRAKKGSIQITAASEFDKSLNTTVGPSIEDHNV